MLTAAFPYKEVFLATTHCHNEQGRVIIAPSEKSLGAVYRDMLAKHRDTEVTAVYKGAIIDLPPDLHVLFCSQMKREAFYEFRHSVTAAVASFYRECGKFPPGTAKCSCFKEGEESKYYNFTCAINAEEYECNKCSDQSYILVDKTWDELFEENGIMPEYPKSGDDRLDDFLVIYSDPGHHQRGTYMRPSSVLREDTVYPASVAGFFSGSKVEMPTSIEDAKESLRKIEEAAKQKTREFF
jgi:hypothetical protein